jgi:hypothetical protein
MNRSRKALLLLLTASFVVVLAMTASPNVRAKSGGPSYTSDGKLIQPEGFRHWKFIGAMVTPNGLNGGKAGFPEFHNVYVEQANFDAYQKNGVFPEGTVIVKELTLTRNATYPDGSTDEASGRGFFEGEPNGLDVTVKDSKKFAGTNNWGFFNFGHHALPYAESSKESSKAECAGCHIAGASKTDMTWIQFYPNLRSKN